MISFADIEYRLSGGVANTDPLLSLGGAMSTERIVSQSGTGITNITGVTFIDGVNNNLGAGTLAYTNSSTSLTWTPNVSVAGAAVDISADGRYGILDSTGNQYIIIDVVSASLPGSDQNDTVTIANEINKLFDDIDKFESNAGDIEYYCAYVLNSHATLGGVAGSLYINTDAVGNDEVDIGLDPAGLNGTATTVVNESTVPAGVTFSKPLTAGAGLPLGNMLASDNYPFWIRRTVPLGTSVSTPVDFHIISVNMGF